MRDPAASRPANPARRDFLLTTAAVGGGLVVGFGVPVRAEAASPMASSDVEVNAWVVVRPDDTCVIRIARSEMGQGTLTGLAQLVVEELECDWNKVGYEFPTPGESLARKRVWGEFGTGGSRGIRISEDYVRRGGAVARVMLLQDAADQWQVPVSELAVANGVVTHAASGRRTTYGKLAPAAARVNPPDPKSLALKDPRTWQVAGKPLKRLDTRPKLNGSLVYAIDLKLPGMLNAAVMACPVYGGRLVSFDHAAIAGMPGVKRAVKVDDATVAVVADTWWHAKKALAALPVVWDEGENAGRTSAQIAAHLKDGLAADKAYAMTSVGDATKAIADARRRASDRLRQMGHETQTDRLGNLISTLGGKTARSARAANSAARAATS